MLGRKESTCCCPGARSAVTAAQVRFHLCCCSSLHALARSHHSTMIDKRLRVTLLGFKVILWACHGRIEVHRWKKQRRRHCVEESSVPRRVTVPMRQPWRSRLLLGTDKEVRPGRSAERRRRRPAGRGPRPRSGARPPSVLGR